jgi:dihydrofolate reductase
MLVSLIVAVAQNGVIGHNNQLIWHLPNDLKQFRKLTTGHAIIMGRRTFDSIGKPLPNRTSIVISRDPNLKIEGCTVANSLEAAIAAAQLIETEEAFIIGGAEIYRLAFSFVNKMYVTEVKADFEGDTFLTIPTEGWKETSRVSHQTDEKHDWDYDFVEWNKEYQLW